MVRRKITEREKLKKIRDLVSAERVAWCLLLLALVATAIIRYRLLEFPLERDEGEFAYVAQLLLDGVPPYLTAYSMKFPGTSVAYAGLMALFGQTTTGVHLGLLFINAITIIVIFLFARALFDPVAAGAAALAYGLLSVSPAVDGMAAHATHFVALFAALGGYALWSASKRRNRLLWFNAGCLFGTAILMKQHAFFLAPFAVAVSLAQVTDSRREWRRNIIDGTLVTLGLGLPFSATCLWLWGAGVFSKFWLWTFDYARGYASEIPLSVGVGQFLANGAIVARPTWPWGVLALAGIVALAFLRDQRRLFLLSFLVASFLCVCPGFFFRPHYFIALLPAVALCIGAACHGLTLSAPLQQAAVAKRTAKRAGIAKAAKKSSSSMHAMAVSLAVTLCAAGISLALRADFFFHWTPQQACRMIYGTNPFVEAPGIADYLAQHSAPDARIAVLGSEPEIFFYSRRRSATGYIYTYSLMEPQPYAEQMQEEMISEIEAARPEYIVSVNITSSWLKRSNSRLRIFKWANSYIAAGYRLTGVIDIVSADRTEYHWDVETSPYTPRSPHNLLIYKLK